MNNRLSDARLRGLILLTGILTILIPFIGSWWDLKFAEILIFEISPFEFNIFIFGEKIYIPLIYWITYSFKILMLISGVSIIAGGLIDRWWSRHLLRFGAGKMLWFVIGMIATILLLSPLNMFLSDIQYQVQEQAFGQIQGTKFLKIPVIGEETVTLQKDNVKISFKIMSKLKPPFFLALIVSVLGIYLRRKTKNDKTTSEDQTESIE